MKLVSLLFFILCLTSCKTDDDIGIDCELFDPANPRLYIKLVDSDGNNLIENKTFIADDVQIVFGDYTMTNVVYYNTLGEEHLIVFSLIGKDGNNTFEIQLSDAVTDTLVLNLESGPQICGWSFLALNSATYNGELQTLEDFSGQNHLITIVK